MSYEVNEPILNSPFDEPSQYWFIREGYEPELKEGRRPAIVYPPREGNTEWELGQVLKLSSPDEFFPGYEMRFFGLCYAMKGGYKGWNPYRERHLAIFVNCF